MLGTTGLICVGSRPSHAGEGHEDRQVQGPAHAQGPHQAQPRLRQVDDGIYIGVSVIMTMGS